MPDATTPTNTDSDRFAAVVKFKTSPQFHDRLLRLAERQQVSVSGLIRQTMVRVVEEAERTDLDRARTRPVVPHDRAGHRVRAGVLELRHRTDAAPPPDRLARLVVPPLPLWRRVCGPRHGDALMGRALDYEKARARDRVAAGHEQGRADRARTRAVANTEREWRHLEFGTPITTRYGGTCVGCGKPIRAGKRAHYSKARGLLHVGRGCRYPEATSTAVKS